LASLGQYCIDSESGYSRDCMLRQWFNGFLVNFSIWDVIYDRWKDIGMVFWSYVRGRVLSDSSIVFI